MEAVGDHLVVADFMWSSPGRIINPFFHSLSEKCSNMFSLKEMWAMSGWGCRCEVECMPTFQFLKKGQKIRFSQSCSGWLETCSPPASDSGPQGPLLLEVLALRTLLGWLLSLYFTGRFAPCFLFGYDSPPLAGRGNSLWLHASWERSILNHSLYACWEGEQREQASQH